MSFTEKMNAYQRGVDKALRDTEIARLFMEEHNDKPPREIAKRFFGSLGQDVPALSTIEGRTYGRITKRFQRQVEKRLRAKGMIPAKRDGATATATVGVIALEDLPEELQRMLARVMIPVMSEEQINEIARQHGHDEGDDCDIIQTLRARRADAIENGEDN